ncbi:MAG TPA: hypothetical protein VF487_16030 [Chitinophagaceae bacterium]
MKPTFVLPRLLTILCIFFIVLIISCNKEKSNGGSDAQEELVSMTSSESDADAETIFNGVFDDIMGVNDDVGMSGTGFFGRAATSGSNEVQRLTGCFTVTITHPGNTLFPARVVIDFGPVACMGPDGHTRRGKIISEYTNRLIIPGAIAATTFENFYFDSIKVEGTHKITNTSSPIATVPLSRAFKLEVINAKLTRPNSNFIEWNSTKTITQIEGLLTVDRPLDDIFRIEGASRGKVLRDNLLVAWESSTVEPLIKRFACRWIVKGTIKTVRANVTTSAKWIAVLNFGTGSCENRAIITVNGVPHEITLP